MRTVGRPSRQRNMAALQSRPLARTVGDKAVARSGPIGRWQRGARPCPRDAPALKPTETLLSMFYPRTLRNVGAALALTTFAMFPAAAFAASAAHTPSGHHAKAHASSAKHRHHAAVSRTSATSASKTSAHKPSHANKTAHGKKKAVKTHHTLPPKKTHRARPTVASQRHSHSHA